ncbi:MAG: hypothetical protein V1494_07705 [Candidatus Diapherotrites archaeon]
MGVRRSLKVNKASVLGALKAMRDSSKPRNFTQSVDLALNFKGIDFKKADKRVDVDVVLPHSTGKQVASKALVFVKDKNFAEQLKGKASKIVLEQDISKISRKEMDGLLAEYSVFLAEGPAMLTVAKVFGQQLAPKGRMPKLIQPSVESFDASVEKFGGAIKVSNKKGKFMPAVHVRIGNEKMPDEQLAENFLAVFNSVVHSLESREQNLKSAYVKLTMGPAFEVSDKAAAKEKKDKRAVTKKQAKEAKKEDAVEEKKKAQAAKEDKKEAEEENGKEKGAELE